LQLEKKAQAPLVSFYPARWWMAAASVIVLVAGLFGAYRWLSRSPELRTAYGEVREQTLPDGTKVVVNADSRIRYSTPWKDGSDREVWLNGEAFFHVRKMPAKNRFIVHTDHFDIIVTGTQFNVVNRQDKNNVMLKEGSVTLHTTEGKDLKMKPGEFVEYRSAQLEKRPVRNDSVLAWKEHKLLFDNTPLRELVKIIKEHYGVTVYLADDALGDRTISGILPNNNLDVLLQAMEATMDFEIVRQENKITIRNHS
jgi:ferric-dicitrate binding protein FerR (iron transport regulator)